MQALSRTLCCDRFCACTCEAEDSAPCWRHPNSDACLPPKRVDVLSVCPPCQPFSVLRSDRGFRAASEHKDYGVIFNKTGSVLSLMATVQAEVIVGEEVTNFAHKLRNVEASHLEDFSGELMAIEKEGGGGKLITGFAALTADAGVWMKVKRSRLPDVIKWLAPCCQPFVMAVEPTAQVESKVFRAPYPIRFCKSTSCYLCELDHMELYW